MKVIKEKIIKLFQYSKLEFMFARKNEFVSVHPELKTLWKRKFRQMIRYGSERTFPILKEFLTVEISKVKDGDWENVQDNAPILICALKNDLDKLSHFLIYYRELGIERFVILDNGSTDGSFEFLLKQSDTTVYQCKHGFTANGKIAWMNRLIAEYGEHKWYLMVDSDEFVSYIGKDRHSISDIITECEKMQYRRVGGAMIDMYSSGNLFDESKSENFLEHLCYMDKDTYSVSWRANGINIYGGPRRRVFGTQMKLSKFCLFYFESDDVIPSAHYMIPFEKSLDVPVVMAILHYKFMNQNDYNKIVEAVKTGMHSNNSSEYKTYYKGIEDNTQVTFYDEKHSIVCTEENLRKIEFLEDIFN